MSLKKNLLKGSLWNGISQFGSQGFNFITTIVLARLLEPNDFGLLGMVMVIINFFGYFTEFGLTPSLIKKKDIDDLDRNTVFWSTLVFAMVFYAITYLFSPLVAMYYDEGRLTNITKVVFISFLISPFGFVQEVNDVRLLKYNRISISEVISSFISNAAAITLALLGFGVWSIAFQNIIRVFFRVSCLNLFIQWKPSFSFSFDRFKELISFGLHFTLRNLLKYVSSNLDFFIVGKLLGATSLGIYTFSFRLSKYPILKLWGVFGKMLFPAFSSISEDKEKIKKYAVLMSLTTFYLFLPYFMFFFWGVDEIISITVGSKWLDASIVIRLLFVYLLAESFSFQDEPILMAIGEIAVVNKIKITFTTILGIVGYFAAKYYGLMGISIVFTFCTSLGLIYVKVVLLRKLKISIRYYLSKMSFFICIGIFFFLINAVLKWGKVGYFNDQTLLYIFVGVLLNIVLFVLFSTHLGFINLKDRKIDIEKIAQR